MSAIYTAYLFAQARARDLWQSPTLPAHLLAQGVAAGAAVLLALGAAPQGAPVGLFRIAVGLHVLLVVGEATMGHATAHAALAARNMIFGAWGHFFWLSLAFAVLGLLFAGSAPIIAAFGGLMSLLLYEHAFVQAGQSVPLA